MRCLKVIRITTEAGIEFLFSFVVVLDELEPDTRDMLPPLESYEYWVGELPA